MRLLTLLGLTVFLAGCGVDMAHVRTGHISTDKEGTTYERQYYVIGVDALCVGGCMDTLPKEAPKHHK